MAVNIIILHEPRVRPCNYHDYLYPDMVFSIADHSWSASIIFNLFTIFSLVRYIMLRVIVYYVWTLWSKHIKFCLDLDF